MKFRITSQRQVLTPGILLGAIISATIALTASADLTNCTPSPSGLVSWWLGEGSASDSAGSNHGTLQNGASCAPGMVGQAFNFNGSNQCVQIPYAPSLANSNYSVEAWVKPLAQVSDPINQNLIFGQGYGQCLLLARPGSTGVLIAFQFGVSHFTFYEAAGTSEIPIGQFTHLAGTWDGTTLRLYINGVLNAQNAPRVSPVDSGCPFYIGGCYSPAAGDCSYVGQFFNGLIDEVSYYKRSLSAAEIQAIYLAGGAGKCPTGTAPSITTQPASQAVIAGSNASFTVTTGGTAPLSYQWVFNGTNISAGTASTLSLTNVQQSQAGSYSVVVTNPYGAVTSSIALLAVNPPASCTPAPGGLVSWWRGEGNALDSAGTNNGALVNGAGFGVGEVGQAFSFNGTRQCVTVPYSSNLAASSYSVEAWVRPLTQVSDPYNQACIIGQAYGWELVVRPGTSGLEVVFLFKTSTVNFYSVVSTSELPIGQFSHVVGTWDRTTLRLYINGTLNAQKTPGATPVDLGYDVYIGGFYLQSGGTVTFSGEYFDGLIDEVSYYNRALSVNEIQAIYNAGSAGKCSTTAPSIITQPASQAVIAGSSASFTVTAGGTAPLSYQWVFNGTNISAGTASTLSLTNVQQSQAGNYSVVVTNAYGAVTSSIALLTVNPPAPCTPAPGGLVSWWQGEGNALDSAGINNGVLVNGTGFGVGEVGQAFSFSGHQQCVDVPYSKSLMATNYSVEAWVKPVTQVSDPYGQTCIIGQAYGWGLVARPGTSGIRVVFQFATSTVNFYSVVSTSELPIGQFSHVVGTWDGTTLRLYVDGALIAQDAPGATPVDLGRDVYIGGFYLLSSSSDPFSGEYFNGLIDEVSYYNRALSAPEITAIYAAGSSGKCLTPSAPYIYAQPTNQVVTFGANVSFSVGASGTPPLTYQWQFNGINLDGAVTSTLTLTSVKDSDAGTYAVVVTNAYGTVTSSNAVLTVNPAPPCAPPPPGLVGWWRGEGNCLDQAGGNNGVLQNGASFATGEIGQAFTFDGANAYVNIPRAPILDVGNQVTIDLWMKADPSTPIGSRIEGLVGSDYYGMEIGNSPAGVWLFLSTDNGAHYVSTADVNGQGAIFPAGEWHHVAGTYDGAKLQFYLDGQPYGNPTPASGAISPMFSSSFVTLGSEDGRTKSPSCIGTRYFSGLIDEVDVFNRALSASEIAAIYAAGVSGKCVLPPSAPYIYAQPANQVVTAGGSVTFSVAAGGTQPLSYQWSFGGLALDGATNAFLILTNVQFSQAGNYSVVITNVVGTASSSNATLSVNFAPASVRVVNVTNAQSGATVSLPVSLAANGNENGLSFSLNFDTTKLTYVSTALGSGASGATLLTNAAQAASGRLGVILALPPNQTFAAGTQELVQVTFMTAVRTYAFSTPVSFGDVPIVRELSDAPGKVLAATYASGMVTIQAATAFEGDLSPRPNGDKAVTLTDWVLEGRYVAGLDYPTNASEFQRADCAPRSTLGDGQITVIDWVQVGRYAAHLDPLTVAGGPTNEVPPGGNVSKPGSTPVTPHNVTCLLEVADTMVIQGLTGTASVQLDSLGNENALGFSLVFDPSALNYVSASLGSAANGVTLFVNDSQAGAGRLGFVLGLGTGKTFVSGTRELVKVTFRATAGAKGKCPVSFAEQPVVCEVSDTNALRLAAGYVNGAITVNPLPSLSIGRSGEAITLAWPLWATNFALQAAEGGLPPAVPWTNLVVVPTLTTNEVIVTLPLAATNKVYRLHQP
jgi:hypothetical protein